MIKWGGDLLLTEIVKLIRGVWQQDPEEWESVLNTAVGVLLYEKGDRSNVANYRCMRLIVIISRSMAK
eukprot:8333037-Pyramimonas_sp.AAC.1